MTSRTTAQKQAKHKRERDRVAWCSRLETVFRSTAPQKFKVRTGKLQGDDGKPVRPPNKGLLYQV